jgi:Holliday junction resolvasome RuvABC endonuclease subunit
MQNLLKMRGIMDFVLGKRRRIEYHNSTWKKRLTGNFRASKEEILAEVNRRFKLKLTEDEQDMADAIGIGAVAYGDQKTN